MKIGIGTALLMVIVVILAGVMIFDVSMPWEDAEDNENGESDNLPATIMPPANEWDSMAEVGFDYSVAGSTTSTIFYDGSPVDPVTYHIEAWHGTTPETASVVTLFDYTSTCSRTVVLDWTVEFGGAYQRGNGALGFKITNQDNGKVWFGWVWEA